MVAWATGKRPVCYVICAMSGCYFMYYKLNMTCCVQWKGIYTCLRIALVRIIHNYLNWLQVFNCLEWNELLFNHYKYSNCVKCSWLYLLFYIFVIKYHNWKNVRSNLQAWLINCIYFSFLWVVYFSQTQQIDITLNVSNCRHVKINWMKNSKSSGSR